MPLFHIWKRFKTGVHSIWSQLTYNLILLFQLTADQCRAQCRALANCVGIMLNAGPIGTGAIVVGGALPGIIPAANCLLLNSLTFPAVAGVPAPASCTIAGNTNPILSCWEMPMHLRQHGEIIKVHTRVGLFLSIIALWVTLYYAQENSTIKYCTFFLLLYH